MADKFCPDCKITITYKNWSKHLKTNKHLKCVENPKYCDLNKAERHRIASAKYHEENKEEINEKRKELYYANGRIVKKKEIKNKEPLVESDDEF